MKRRSLEPEIMDLGPQFYTIEEYNDCLLQLGRIGKYLGTDKIMLKMFDQLPFEIDSILDVGCGGGSFTSQLASNFIRTNVLGIDISGYAIDYAKNNYSRDNLKFELRNDPGLNEVEKSFDIVTTTLVLHHLSDDQIIEFFKKSALIARKAIIINDLHRHWLSYTGCSIIMPLFFPNRLTINDSLLSIKKSFRHDELKSYLDKAGFSSKNYTISWHWPFRWIVKVML